MPTHWYDSLQELEWSADGTLQGQVYEQFARAILSGNLRPGDRLPSTRELAKVLGIGRNTASWVFEQLAMEGFVRTRRGSGTYVSDELPDFGALDRLKAKDTGPADIASSTLARRAARYSAVARSLRVPQRPVPFRINMPAVDDFPIGLWRRVAKSLMADGAGYLLGETEPAGYDPLREAIARYLIINRGVVCTPDQVVIVAGAQQGLDLATRLLLDIGDQVLCEDPGFPGSVAALRAAGARIGAVPVGPDGFDIGLGARTHPDARLAVVCPSSQFPLGTTMSLANRLALIEWAKQNDGWIIEDDYDSEFRYRGRPVRSLQGLDGGNRVVYIGTFSKVLFPGLRLAYLVVPKPVVELFVNARIVAGRQSPTFEQVIVERFITEGHLGRHVARMRRLYAERRQALIRAVGERLPHTIRLQASETGLQMLGWLPDGWDDAAVSALAATRGLEITPLSRLSVDRSLPPALLLGFGNFPPARIAEGVDTLAAVIDAYAGWHRP